MTAAALLAILNGLITLEPAAVKLVEGLIAGLQGKSDAEILAGDAQDWASIIIVAHQAQQPPPPTAVGPAPAKKA
jgi:hypothetical protein